MLQGKYSSGESREVTVAKIAEDMLRKLPKDYSPHDIKDALMKLGGMQPMNIFLRLVWEFASKIFS